MPRDGRYIEEVGKYNPVSNPKVIDLDIEKIDEWIAKGAKPTESAAALIKVAREGVPAKDKKVKPSKKAVAAAAKAAEEAAQAAEEAAAESADAE